MDSTNTSRLHLLSPLFYGKTGEAPFSDADNPAGERLYQFEINPAEAQSIEPGEEHYLGSLIESGAVQDQMPARDTVELPAGAYLFAQVHAVLNREDFIHIAVEVQKDGLWERMRMEDRCYLRFLYEHGRPVSQVLRPLKNSELSNSRTGSN
jgi:hypothetical protein